MTINQEWLDYQKKVIPADAPAIQVIECQRAFYAGALAYKHCAFYALSAGDDISEEDLRRMQRLDAELWDFVRKVWGPAAPPAPEGEHHDA